MGSTMDVAGDSLPMFVIVVHQKVVLHIMYCKTNSYHLYIIFVYEGKICFPCNKMAVNGSFLAQFEIRQYTKYSRFVITKTDVSPYPVRTPCVH